jgi:hypothetical protein
VNRLVKALLVGFRDGWAQPYELGSSTNIDHWSVDWTDVHEWLDRGINLGQLARAGRQSETYRERLWPMHRRRP